MARSVVLAAIIALVATPFSSLAKDSRIQAFQLVRFVVETGSYSGWYSSYYRKVENGTLRFNDKYRHPHYPPGPAEVDCTKTRMIGLTYLLTRTHTFMPTHVKTRITWTHSNVNSQDDILDYYRERSFVTGQATRLVTHGFELTEEWKVDGVMNVRVLLDENELLQNSFKLIGCPGIAQ